MGRSDRAVARRCMHENLVIIPVYNEEATIEAVLGELCRYYSGDVLIVDDGSTDHSMQRINSCIRERLAAIHHDTNRGYGASLIDGFHYAAERGYRTMVTMDCDFQHEPCQVPELFDRIADRDVLSGSRYLELQAGDMAAPPERMRINHIITERINAITDFNLTDSFCGFKAYDVSAVAKLTLDEEGYAFPLQFWIQAHLHHLKVAELPVARIYNNLNRSFGATLDDPAVRLAHYNDVIDRELARWNPGIKST